MKALLDAAGRLLGLKPKAPPYVPPDIRIAGIYTVCSRLRLPKYGEPRHDPAMKMLVAMNSGAFAVYAYASFEPASNVDWGWHVFRFERYLKPGEGSSLPRYHPDKHYEGLPRG